MSRNVEQEVKRARRKMATAGYRPVTIEDIASGKQLVMVDVEQFARTKSSLSPGNAPGSTHIDLNLNPVRLSNAVDGRKVVYYRCKYRDEQCFIQLDTFLHDAYVNDPYANETRYFIRK
jgi:hypothetical protein